MVSVSGFSINSADLNGVLFTVPAGLNDRTKIGSWKLAHKIVKIADGTLVGFKYWSFTIEDPCNESLLIWTFTPVDSTAEITVADSDFTIVKTSQYKFSDSSYFDTSITYDMLSNTPSARPCFDVITFTISSLPPGIL